MSHLISFLDTSTIFLFFFAPTEAQGVTIMPACVTLCPSQSCQKHSIFIFLFQNSFDHKDQEHRPYCWDLLLLQCTDREQSKGYSRICCRELMREQSESEPISTASCLDLFLKAESESWT